MVQSRVPRRHLLKAGVAAAGLASLSGIQMILPPSRGGVLSLPLAAAAPSPPEEVLSLSVGSGPGQVGIWPGAADQEALGPESFAIHNGALYVLDTVNRRLQVVGLRGGPTRSVDIAGAVYPSDLQVVSENELYVLDTGADHLYELSGAGTVLQKHPLSKELLSAVYQIAVNRRGDVVATDIGGVECLYLVRNGRPVPPAQQRTPANTHPGWPTKSSDDAYLSSYRGLADRAGSLKVRTPQGGILREIPIGVAAILGGFRFLGADRAGNVFVLVDEVQESFPIVAEQVVRKYAPDGRLIGTAHVPLEQRFAIARRNVVLGEDGEVYCLIAERNRVRLLRLPQGNLTASLLPGALPVALPTLRPGLAEAAELVRPSAITRDGCIDIAYSYWSHTWYCTYTNYIVCYGSGTSTLRPDYIQQGGWDRNYYEVPYNYNGFDSVSGFDSRMSQGHTAGNVRAVSLTGCAAGVDCSGYVSRCWGLGSKYGTCTLVEQLPVTAVDKQTQLQRGDILNRVPCSDANAHVRLFRQYVTGGCFTYESSVSNGGRVWGRSYTWTDLQAYQGYRYDGFS